MMSKQNYCPEPRKECYPGGKSILTTTGLRNKDYPVTTFTMPFQLRRFFQSLGVNTNGELFLNNVPDGVKEEWYAHFRAAFGDYVSWMQPCTFGGQLSRGYHELVEYTTIIGDNICVLGFSQPRNFLLREKFDRLVCSAVVYHPLKHLKIEGEDFEVAIVDENEDLEPENIEVINIGGLEGLVVKKHSGGRKEHHALFPDILPNTGKYCEGQARYNRLLISVLSATPFSYDLRIPLNDNWNPRLFLCEYDDSLELIVALYDPTKDRFAETSERLTKLVAYLSEYSIQEALIDALILYDDIATAKVIAENILSSSTPSSAERILTSRPSHRERFKIKSRVKELNLILAKIREGMPEELNRFYSFLGKDK